MIQVERLERYALKDSIALIKLNWFIFNFRREAIWMQEVRQAVLAFGLLLAAYEPPLQVLQTYATWHVRWNLRDVRNERVCGHY